MSQLNYDVDENGKITITSDLEEGTDLSTDISGITLLQHGAKAETKPLNDNFTYLNIKCNTLNTKMDTLSDNVEQSVISITNNRLNEAFYTIHVISGTNASGQLNLSANNAYAITPSDDITLVLYGADSTVTNGVGTFHQILVQLNLTNTGYFSASRLGTTHYFDDMTPTFNNVGLYDIIYEYDNNVNQWFVGAIYKGVVSNAVS